MKFLTAGLLSLAICGVATAETATQTAAPASAEKTAEQTSQTQPQTTEKPADESAAPGGLDTLSKRAGYAIGLSIGQNFKSQQIDVDLDAFFKGLTDGAKGNTPLLDERAAQMAMFEFQQHLQARQMEAMRAAATKNKAEGEAFLAKNKTVEGVKTTASGLQYSVITEGQGESPKATDTVTVHYSGKLLDGTEFDSSYQRNEPATFPLNGVIAGWTEGLQLMKPGAKYKFFIPASLAYGEQGYADVIPPEAVLVFEVELISAKAAPAQQPGHEGHNH